jgi:hypothetical protein
VESACQGQAALVSYQVHDSKVEPGGVELPEQGLVFKDHLAVDVGDTVEVPRDGERFVSVVPQDFPLHSNIPDQGLPLTKLISSFSMSNSPFLLMYLLQG